MHQRNKFQKYIVPLIKDNCCCICGCEIDLEVHHEKLFSEMILETLDSLELELKDTKKYTKAQLSLITDIMLGKQLQNTYRTLCEKCHTDQHIGNNGIAHFGKVYYENYRKEKAAERKRYNEELKIYLDSIVSKPFYSKDKYELIEKCNFRKDGRIIKSINCINKELIKHELNYVIYSKMYYDRNRLRKTYWEVERM